MIVHIIRHTPVNVPPGTCYGFSDVALANDWLEYAARVKGKIPLEALTADNVYSSPLSRCLLLSQQLSDKPREDERLKEMNYGRWEGRLWSEIGKPTLDAWLSDLTHYTTPQGESLGEVYDRGAAFLDELQCAGHEEAFVVTHGGMVRCLIAHVIGLDVGHAAKLSVDYASVTRVRLEGELKKLETMNV